MTKQHGPLMREFSDVNNRTTLGARGAQDALSLYNAVSTILTLSPVRCIRVQ